MQTGKSLIGKGKGKATSSSGQLHLYKVTWDRHMKVHGIEWPETGEGYTTSSYDIDVCNTLGMECVPYGSYDNIALLQVAKAKITEDAEMIYKRHRQSAQIPTREEIEMYWITRKGIVDKIGSNNSETVLTLGRKFVR
jgi:hypothetical protein